MITVSALQMQLIIKRIVTTTTNIKRLVEKPIELVLTKNLLILKQEIVVKIKIHRCQHLIEKEIQMVMGHLTKILKWMKFTVLQLLII